MSTSRALVLGTAAVAALAGIAAGTATTGGGGTAQAGLRDVPAFLVAPLGDEHQRGSLAAVQRTKAPKAAIFVSLHGLTPSSSYTGVLSASRCGAKAKPILDLVGVVKTGAGEDDFFANKTGRLKARLARGKSFHLLRDGTEIACASASRVR